MRISTYRVLLIIVAIAATISLSVDLLIKDPMISASFSMVTALAQPIPSQLFWLSPFPVLLVVRALVITMWLLVVHRIVLSIRTRTFAPPASFGTALYRLAATGIVCLGVAIAFLATSMIPHYGIALPWLGVPAYGIAIICIPLAFFLTEILSLRDYVGASKT